jgi:enoyl-CoA hydratase
MPVIHRDDRSPVAVIRLERGKAQALDLELTRALAAELDELEGCGDHNSVVLTGTGSIFSAGVDLFRVLDGGAEYVEELLPLLAATFRKLFAFPRPVIAAMNGHAIAGGCVLACACDYRMMAQGTGTIGVPELRVGVPFPLVAIEILRFAASTIHLQELLYLGKAYAVEEAYSRGLVDEIVEADQLLDRACDAAARLASEPAARFRITKRQLRQPTLDHIDRNGTPADAEVLAAWKDPRTLDAIRYYLEETLGRKL